MSIIRALTADGWRAVTEMSGEYVMASGSTRLTLAVRPDGQIVRAVAEGEPEALAAAARTIAAELTEVISPPPDLAALARLLPAAGLPWEHDGGGEIVQRGLGSAGWVGETLHVGEPDVTRRYAELIVGAVNALPTLLRIASAAQEWARCERAGESGESHRRDLLDAVDELDAMEDGAR